MNNNKCADERKKGDFLDPAKTNWGGSQITPNYMLIYRFSNFPVT